jgi:hypothetical protein
MSRPGATCPGSAIGKAPDGGDISVGGEVLKSGSASGGYDICSSQIGQDPLTGAWEGE